MKSLKKKIAEAVHRYSFFGRIEETADRRRHAFNKRLAVAEAHLVRTQREYRELIAADAPQQRREDAEQLVFISEHHVKALKKRREFWRNRYVWAHQRHHHWGKVLKHRRDRLRRWIFQHRGFRAYMANGHPHEKLTPEAKHGIYLDFKEGLYVTSTYEGYPGDGVHATSSYHYLQNQPDGKARCWDAASGSRGRMVKAQRREATRCPAFLVEMIGPENDCEYKNGIRYTLSEGSALETMHDSHVHEDIRDGAPQ